MTEIIEIDSVVREYYETLDTHSYDLLESLLAPEFVHDRPDMTLDGREQFVEFMREKRPMTETTHPIDAVYPAPEGVAVQGRLLDENGKRITGFVDVFSIEDGSIAGIKTYTD